MKDFMIFFGKLFVFPIYFFVSFYIAESLCDIFWKKGLYISGFPFCEHYFFSPGMILIVLFSLPVLYRALFNRNLFFGNTKTPTVTESASSINVVDGKIS